MRSLLFCGGAFVCASWLGQCGPEGCTVPGGQTVTGIGWGQEGTALASPTSAPLVQRDLEGSL